jgi:hypothetical protein
MQRLGLKQQAVDGNQLTNPHRMIRTGGPDRSVE